MLSPIGIFAYSKILRELHVSTSALISCDFPSAKGIEESVKITTPPVPFESAITQSAEVFDTSARMVVTFEKRPSDGCAPDVAAACQPITGIFAAFAAAISALVVAGSKPPTTIPSALSVTA